MLVRFNILAYLSYLTKIEEVHVYKFASFFKKMLGLQTENNQNLSNSSAMHQSLNSFNEFTQWDWRDAKGLVKLVEDYTWPYALVGEMNSWLQSSPKDYQTRINQLKSLVQLSFERLDSEKLPYSAFYKVVYEDLIKLEEAKKSVILQELAQTVPNCLQTYAKSVFDKFQEKPSLICRTAIAILTLSCSFFQKFEQGAVFVMLIWGLIFETTDFIFLLKSEVNFFSKVEFMVKIIGNCLIITFKIPIKNETKDDIRDSYEKGNFFVAIFLIFMHSVPFLIWGFAKLKKCSNESIKEE